MTVEVMMSRRTYVYGASSSHSGVEVRCGGICVDRKLGNLLPCLVIPADLRMACTLAYRRWPLLTVRYSTRTARRWLSRIGACLLTVRPLGRFAARGARIKIICWRGCAGLPQDATG
jgi:hypothetical protein